MTTQRTDETRVPRRVRATSPRRPGATFVLATALLAACSDKSETLEPFVEPPRIQSQNGVLEAELRAALGPIDVAGPRVMTRTYNDLLVPPTLDVKPGDVIRLTLRNEIDEGTNLHYHGMNVTPILPGDNVFLTAQPGELQLWSVGHIGADIYYDLELEGHTLYEAARDGNRHNQLVAYDHILLPTSSRTEFLMRGGPPGTDKFETRFIDMGPERDRYPETTLATLTSAGPAVTPIALPTDFPPVQDRRELPACYRRTYDFSENAVFHIHQLDFQVIEKNG